MTSFRDSLLADIDDARSILDDLGLRDNTVFLRRRSWSGGQLGSGTATTTDSALRPTPKAKRAGKPVKTSAGLRDNRDWILTKLSRQLTEADLTGAPLAAGEEQLWVVDDVECVLFEVPEHKRWEWTVTVTPITATVLAVIDTPIAAPTADYTTGDVAHTTTSDTARAIRRGVSLSEVQDAAGAYEVGDEALQVLADHLSVAPSVDSAVTIDTDRYRVIGVSTDDHGISHTLTIRHTP